MPNWIEGSMKLRGKRENIKKFINKGLNVSTAFGEQRNREEQIISYSTDEYLDYTFKDDPYISGTRRAFITSDCFYMEDDEGVACLNVKQAWGFICDDNDKKVWENISKDYDLDIKLYGIEQGMEFCQEVIILQGKCKANNVIHYENWNWDCPFPRMGG